MSGEMNDFDIRVALGLWAEQMAMAAQMQATAYSTFARAIVPDVPWSPVRDLPIPDRPARQALFLAAMKLRTDDSVDGSIPMKESLRLAQHFGYDSRGTAGFYRRSPDGSPGLLVRDGELVRLGAAGLERISEFADLVAESSARIESSRGV